MNRLVSSFLLGVCLLGAPVIAPAREAQKEAPKGYGSGIKVELLALTNKTANGDPIVYPKTENPEVRILKVTIPPGHSTGWHTHPMPAYGYLLAGELTVELPDGSKNTIKTGQAVVEVVNVLHEGTNTGSEPAVVLMVITTEKDKPATIAGEKPATATKP